MINFEMTIGELLAKVKETNAGMMKLVGREENGDPRYAIVVLMGKETTAEVIAAIENLELIWDKHD